MSKIKDALIEVVEEVEKIVKNNNYPEYAEEDLFQEIQETMLENPYSIYLYLIENNETETAKKIKMLFNI